MKSPKILLLLFIIPWLSLPLLGKKAFKKYGPAALFICMFTTVINKHGQKKKWWKFYKGIPPLHSMHFFNFGPYFISSLWILKMTYGKLPLFMLSNGMLHLFFIFTGCMELVSKYKIFTLQRLTKFKYLLLNTFRSLLLYGFQYVISLGKKTN